MPRIYKNDVGYYIITKAGNMVYLPDAMTDFCDDWLDGMHNVMLILNESEGYFD